MVDSPRKARAKAKAKAKPAKRRAASKRKLRAELILPGKRGSGYPKFEPTPEHRLLVRSMIGFGIQQHEIAAVLINPSTGNCIDEKTLRKYFPTEILTGRTVAKTALWDRAYKLALAGNSQLLIFLLKVWAGATEKVDINVNAKVEVTEKPAIDWGAMSPAELKAARAGLTVIRGARTKDNVRAA